jgi:hypothetical protein
MPLTEIQGEKTFAELMTRVGAHKLYDKWIVRVRTLNQLLGGWPKNPEAELAMLEARFRKGLVKEETVEAARQAIADESSDDHQEETDKAKEKAWTGFKDKNLDGEEVGIHIESRQIKAGFKEAATTLGLTISKRGTKQVMQHAMFVRGTEDPDRIFFYREKNGEMEQILEPDGTERMVAHVTGPQGPRSTIKFHDYILPGAIFEFELWRACSDNTIKVAEGDLIKLLTLCQDNGWGCSRSQGFGRVEILSMTPIAEGERAFTARAKAEKKDKEKKDNGKSK